MGLNFPDTFTDFNLRRLSNSRYTTLAKDKVPADISFERVRPSRDDYDDLLERMQGLNITPGMRFPSQLKEAMLTLNLDVRYHTQDFFAPEATDPETTPLNSIQERFQDVAQMYLDAGNQVANNRPADLLRPLFAKKFHEFTNRQFVGQFLTPVINNNHLVVRLEDLLTLDDGCDVIKSWRPDFVIFAKHECQPLPLGAVEVTSGGSLNASALYQCMLYMVALHTKARYIVFGIVTDALQYVLMSLDTEGTFHLEANDTGKCTRIRAGETWDNLRDIALRVNGLCKRSKR